MAHVMRPLMQWPRWHHHCCSRASFYHLLSSSLPVSSNSIKNHNQLLLFTSSFRFCYGDVRFSSRARRLRDVPLPPDSAESDSDSSSDANLKKSRNKKKREAKRAVQWGMELAKFAPPQIKRILRVASLENEVYDAVMLVKRLGRDVREGKRRQFNYIGRFLREVDPELMDGLIQATKDGDQIKFTDLSGSETLAIENENENDEAEETEYEYEEEDSKHHTDVATRWYDGLINKDVDIMNEVYSLQEVDFDRQELRTLVRKVHFALEHQASSNEKGEKLNAGVAIAKRSLTRFLRGLAEQLSVE